MQFNTPILTPLLRGASVIALSLLVATSPLSAKPEKSAAASKSVKKDAKTLHFTNARDVKASLKALEAGKGQHVQDLVLSDHIGDAEAIAFANLISSGKLPALGSLQVHVTDIGDAGAKALAAALSSGKVPHLRYVAIFTHNKISKVGGEAIFHLISSPQVPSLKHFTLFGCKMGETAAATFETMPIQPQLASLQLDGSLGTVGVSALVSAIASNKLPKLRYLAMGDNQIGDTEAKAIADVILAGKTPMLQDLNLRDSQIGDSGILALSKAFSSGKVPHLKNLILDVRKAGDKSVATLVAAVTSGKIPELSSLVLGDRKFDKAEKKALEEAKFVYEVYPKGGVWRRAKASIGK